MKNIDELELDGGGLIEIIGKKGSGKTQTLLSICANKSIAGKKIAFIDCTGSFRPELIESMIINKTEDKNVNPKNILRNIIYYRSYSLEELDKFIKIITITNANCLVFDDIFQLFFYKFRDNLRLEVRRFIRNLAILALSKKIEIFFTNTIFEREIPNTLEKYHFELFYHEIIRYVHIKIILIENIKCKQRECLIIYPSDRFNNKFNL